MDLSYFEVIALWSPHSACCSIHPKPPYPQLGLKYYSQALDQIMMPLSLGPLIATGNHVGSVYHLFSWEMLHSFVFPKCQVYSNLFGLGWGEYKDRRCPPLQVCPQAVHFRRERPCGRKDGRIQGKTMVAITFGGGGVNRETMNFHFQFEFLIASSKHCIFQ